MNLWGRFSIVGSQPYGSVEYKGTWFTTDSKADQYFGLVFGYVSNRKFYVVLFKGKHYNYKDGSASTYKGGVQGVQIKVILFYIPMNDISIAVFARMICTVCR